MRVFLLLVFWSCVSAPAAFAATLNVAILQPKPVITSENAIKFSASTSEYVFSSTAFRITSSFALNGNDILWDIRSEPTSGQGGAIVLEMYHSNTLNPLPSGDYRLLVNWAHSGFGTIPGAPRSGQGELTFSVAAAPIRAGDFNQDGSVDGTDFLLWQHQAGSVGPMEADGNDDLVVDGLDLDLWKNGLALVGTSATASAAIPEPATVVMTAISLLFGAQQKKRLSQRPNKQEMGRCDRAAR
ncbi:MAG: hypothetical protein C0485_18105 [Pirellula sp.]|nr:hypothetical protein [Pirellula sp.]